MVWRLAGQIGIDPRRLTLRQLAWMAEARSRQQWDHTSQVLCLIANTMGRGPNQPAFVPEQFHPYREYQPEIERLTPREGMELLKKIYGGGNV